MTAPKSTASLLVLLLAIASSLGACGSSSETSSEGKQAERQPGTASTQFESKGGDNSIQEFGSEASASERAAAAAVLHEYLDARAERDWKAACTELAPGLSRSLAQQLGNKDEKVACAAILAKLTAAVPDAGLRQAAVAAVGSLRVDGAQAFLLFHGADEGAYFMPMTQEGGDWKVAAIAASPLL